MTTIRRVAIAFVVFLAVLAWSRRLIAPGSVTNPDRWEDPITGMAFVLVRPHAFRMGTPTGVAGREPQEVPHDVTLTRPYYIARDEVTQEQWIRLMDHNPSHFQDCGPSCPVESVTFHDVQEFIRRLNERNGPGFRLPTEAEWEAACLAGGDQPFGHSSSLSSRDANIDGNYPYNAPQGVARKRPTRAGYFPANAWGLHDMSGNVWEWVQDWHCPYPTSAVTDPAAVCNSGLRVIRGGSWAFDGNSARCALRYTHRPQDEGYSLGFRLARDVW